MFKSKNQIRCTRCHLVRKRCITSDNGFCAPCNRISKLQASNSASVVSLESELFLEDYDVRGANSDESTEKRSIHEVTEDGTTFDEEGCIHVSIKKCKTVTSILSTEDGDSDCDSDEDYSVSSSDGISEGSSSDDQNLNTDEEYDDMIYSESLISKEDFQTENETEEETADEEFFSENEAFQHSEVRCLNCKRENLPSECTTSDPIELKVSLFDVDVATINFRQRKWRCFDKVDCTGSTVRLCKSCRYFLSKESIGDKQKTNWKFIWPAYIWRLFRCQKTKEAIGAHVLRVIPDSWVKYWVFSLYHIIGYKIDTLLPFIPVGTWSFWRTRLPLPPSTAQKAGVVTKDVTVDKRRFVSITLNLKLGDLKNGCNKYLMPTILCPWGCSTYLHKSGVINFDAVIARYLSSVSFAGTESTKTQNRNMESARADFFSAEIDCHLYNPSWSVHPSVYFHKKKGPVFLSCPEHNGGTANYIFHLPRSDSSLPSPMSDSLSHAVLRSRTIRASKAKHYSNSFQLQKCTASYCGIDTCYISEQRLFDATSHLLDLSESRSYYGREDIRGLLSQLAVQGEVSTDFEHYVKKRSNELYGHNELSSEDVGGSMMTLSDTMKLQKMLHAPSVITINVFDNNGVSKLVDVKRLWTPCLVFIHPNDGYGAAFRTVGSYGCKSDDSRIVWCISTLLCSLPKLWELVSYSVSDNKSWRGFFLTYLSTKVLEQKLNKKTKSDEPHPFYIAEKDKRFHHTGLLKLLLDEIGVNDIFEALLSSGFLFNCFGSEIQSGCVSVIPIPSILNMESLSNLNVSVKTGCSLVFFYRESDFVYDRSNLTDLVMWNDCSYELRIIVEVDVRSDAIDSNTEKAFPWSGSVYVRHGSSLFPRWWKLERGHKRYHVTGLDDVRWNSVVVLGFEKIEDISLKQYREDYLKYIGGQAKAYCAEHDVPFIVSKIKKGEDYRLCQMSNNCQQNEKYICPIDDCSGRICSKCYLDLPDGITSRINPINDRSLDKSSSQSFDISHEQGQDDNDSTSQSFDLSHGKEQGDIDVCDINDAYDEDRSSLPSNTQPMFDFSELHTGDGAPIEDIENASLVDDDELENEFIVPTTHSATQPLTCNGDFGYMGASVLLNKCGTMLVRRQTQLQASRRERNIIETVVSRYNTGTVPLVYLEGMVFPSIFWCLPCSSEGGVLGSIPTAFFCQHDTRKQFNVASVAEHMKIRLKSASTTASTDPRYLSFAFDALANGALEGHDTRVVLSRGFEESMGPAGLRVRNKDDDFYTDTIDNRQNVHTLAASEREQPSSLFITLTCNQREHFGVKNIKLYVDGDEALDNYLTYIKTKHKHLCFDISEASKKEIRKSFHEAAKTLIVRNWMEVRLLLISYISKSTEKPLGKVTKMFARDEYQNDVGNLSHVHMLVSLEHSYGTDEGRKHIQNLVRGSIDEIVGVDEIEQFIREGILDDYDDYFLMKEQAKKFLPHIHSPRCMMRTGPGDKDLSCRVPDVRKLSKDLSTFFELILDIHHTEEALCVLERLHLCESRTDNAGKFVPLYSFLKGKRILPPARLGEGNISPVMGKLFAATRSTMNIQICTSFGTSRYIVKYLIKIDENNYVVFSGTKDDATLAVAERVHLNNTKITSSAIHEKKRLDQSRHKTKPKGRQVASTEQIQLILGYPQVITNIESIKVPTLPLAERAGFERLSPKERFNSLKADWGSGEQDAFSFMVPSVRERKDMFPKRNTWRQHTDSQIAMLRDQMESKVTLDRVFIFGIRPPELLCINTLESYYRFFIRSDYCIVGKRKIPFRKLVEQRADCSAWIDGLGYRIKIRPTAFQYLIPFLEQNPRNDEHRIIQRLIGEMNTYWQETGITVGKFANACNLTRGHSARWKHLQNLFVDTDLVEKPLPIPVFSNVKPLNAPRFIIHVLLSMGHFETEADLWSEPSLRLAFQKAQLIDKELNNIRSSVDNLLKRWILEQLQFYPIGSKKMDEYMISADSILTSAIIDDEIPMDEIPPYFYTSLVTEINKKQIQYLQQCKENLVMATLSSLERVYGDLTGIVPSKQELVDATKSNPLAWNGTLPKTNRQSSASFNEQKTVQTTIMTCIQSYMKPKRCAVKNFIVAGPPGAGKTHCMSHGIIYCLSQGLYATTTALLADRAFVLGGQHIHKLFCLKVRDSGSPSRLAELAIISLQKKPEMIALLRRLDVLFVDEMGQISAGLLAVLDIILRRIRNSNLFMAGLLVIGTIDQHQLRPVKGLPFLMSPFVLTCFRIAVLKQYVRCAACVHLQTMNEIARLYTNDGNLWEAKLIQFEKLVRCHCTFVDNWSDPAITDDVISIFPRKKQTTKATQRFIQKKKRSFRDNGQKVISVDAHDQMLSLESHGDWRIANQSSTEYLNLKSKEPQSLEIYIGAIYEFTFNKPGRFNATQLGVLMDLPDETLVQSFKDFPIFVAPAGTKTIDCSNITKESLLSKGWKQTMVCIAPQHSRTIYEKNLKVRRKQYGIRIHVSSTIHSAIGSTLGKVATQLNVDGTLWERAMVVVLISRVTHAKDLIFVGNKDDNIRALVNGLRVRDQFAEYMNHIVESLATGTSTPITVDFSFHPFRPKDIPLPPRNNGIVYMLVSSRDQRALYVGQTIDIEKRLKAHNSGIGSNESADPSLRPWALFAYVTGFAQERKMMRSFEKSWQESIHYYRPRTPYVALQYASELIEKKFPHDQLLLVQASE